jgi:hypothetical protein
MNKPQLFEFPNIGTVQIWPAKENKLLYILMIDAYGFQRELMINWDEEKKLMKVHSYMHTCLRHINWVTKDTARNFVEKLRDMCERYPDLLFNKGTEDIPRAKGFVVVHNRLLMGDQLSRDMI